MYVVENEIFETHNQGGIGSSLVDFIFIMRYLYIICVGIFFELM